MLTIDNQPSTNTIPLLNLGFRPFFLAAAFFSVLATMIWSGVYLMGWQFTPYGVSAMTWHAHEMIYGYAIAVVAGFLLTAVRNWTNHQTLNDLPLLFLLLLWLAARVLSLSSEAVPLLLIAVIDNGFILVLLASIGLLLIRARQWMNLVVVSLLLLMLVSNLIYYAGVAGLLEHGLHTGLYLGLYTILALIFIMGRRVIPFFIEKGVGYPVQLKNWSWLDISSLLMFALFVAADLLAASDIATILSAILFLLHGVRLLLWHTPGIWRKPLLWSLYCGYAFLAMGFGLKVAAALFALSPYQALHAFTYGGIGLITIGMMARVALGHTGRNVFQPPRILFFIFLVLLVGAVLRVIIPIISPAYYVIWIGLAQLLWVISFTVFFVVYAPILVKSRIDGQYG